MLSNWLGGAIAVVGTVLLQYGTQALLTRFIPQFQRQTLHLALKPLKDWKATLLTVFGLIFCHLGQVAIWAGLYFVLGEFADLGDALHFSLGSFTTTGSGPVTLSQPHRVLAPLEAVVAALMFGWSTALLVALLIPRGLGAAASPPPKEERHDPAR